MVPLEKAADEVRNRELKMWSANQGSVKATPSGGLGAGTSTRKSKALKPSRTSAAVAESPLIEASMARLKARTSKAKLAAPDLEVRSVSDSSIAAMKTSIGRLGLDSTPVVATEDRLQASGSRMKEEGFHIDTFFADLDPFSYDPNGPRPGAWKVDSTLSRLEYIKSSEQHLARPIQDMIDRRAETIDRMMVEWRSLAPSRIGLSADAQATGSGKGKRKASVIEEDVVDVEEDAEEVDPGLEEFATTPDDDFEDIGEVGPQDVEMGQEGVDETQPGAAA